RVYVAGRLGARLERNVDRAGDDGLQLRGSAVPHLLRRRGGLVGAQQQLVHKDPPNWREQDHQQNSNGPERTRRNQPEPPRMGAYARSTQEGLGTTKQPSWQDHKYG